MTDPTLAHGAKMRRGGGLIAAATLAASLLLIPAPAAFADDVAPAIPGPLTAGDPVFPNVGNGGYDALDYQVSLTWTPDPLPQAGPLMAGSIDAATTTMTARAAQPLSSFALDFEGMEVDSVTVNGTPATFTRAQDADAISFKLIITPATPVSGEFTTTIAYHGVPVTHIDADGSAEGWSRTTDGAILLGQPVGMMAGYPHNNTPGDKATATFTLDIPTTLSAADGSNPGPAAAVSTGELLSRTPSEDGARTTWVWQQRKQLASELALIAIGRYDIVEGEITLTSGRTIPSWSFMDSQLSAADKEKVRSSVARLQTVTQQLESLYGPYPGNSTGVVVDSVPRAINYALETQDRSFFPSANSVAGNTLIHEVAHQWYGNNVSPTTWTDIWIAEGMATWAPRYVNSTDGFGTGNTTETSFYEDWQRTPADSDAWAIAPGAQTDSAMLYDYQTYSRGGQFWEALKIAIGDENYRAVVAEWQTRYAGTSVAGAQLRALAEEISGRDLDAFWEAWILTPAKPAWPEKLTASLTTPERSASLERGDRVSYSLSAANTGLAPLASSVITVDVTTLLASATLDTPLPAGLTLEGTTLTWAVPETAAGATATTEFAATVTDSASGGTIDTVAAVATLGGTCTDCSTSLPISEYEITPAPVPVIAGEARVASTLTAATAGWPEATVFTHQWNVGGVPVPGASDTSFVIPESALGETVTVTATGTAPGHLPTAATSSATAAVQAARVDPKPDPEGPVAPSEDALTDALRGAISFPSTVAPGQRITVGLGAEFASTTVESWLFSTPSHLGSRTVDAHGTIELTIPKNAELGTHRLAVAQADGTVIGWGPLTIAAATPDTATPSTGGLAKTGGSVPLLAGALGATLLLSGAVLIASRRIGRNAQ
ncbi:metallopeptidase [Leucobacter sp. 7(1)]|uniref:M1 family metallopeptidase n=1 Tax=Leucobacter sp. 7(1) TaxID=1255613 RepID=UPI00097F5BE4|nr:M1 family metallopeptidase [Leucobacter sp. 7(1)]SJN08392.1 metallopeptidase [Leucobacter sp. 7(1)]